MKDPIREWREQFGRQMLNLDFEPLSDASFQASFQPIFDGMRMVRTSFSPGLTIRDDELVRDGDDSFTLIISQTTKIDAAQRARSVRLNKGDATLVSVCSPGTVGAIRNFSFVGMMIPYGEIRERTSSADDSVVTRIHGRSEPLQLLRGYIRTLERSKQGSLPTVTAVIRRHVFDLIGLCVSQPVAIGESDFSAVLAARMAAASEFVGINFLDPELSVTSAAQGLGISPRYLQKLFERSGTGFNAHVNELRLQHAWSLLQRSGVRVRILDIALQSGFSDLSHFNRLFRSRFGETPGGVRAGTR